jgi:hypothetical protein
MYYNIKSKSIQYMNATIELSLDSVNEAKETQLYMLVSCCVCTTTAVFNFIMLKLKSSVK